LEWCKEYKYADEAKYTKIIGKRNKAGKVDRRCLKRLFEWKIGGLPYHSPSDLAAKYLAIEANYPADEVAGRQYARTYLSGGAVYNIFWLHCVCPRLFPIFDQHAYRAMRYIKGGKLVEIPATNAAKMEAYWNEYVPFFKRLQKDSGLSQRKLDRALFTMGRFLKA
jgi:hypothetical protein